MAGPLSSEEIEDVVSSVRRLVSNELSPRRVSRDLGSDRLLLTPSLRVVSELSPLAPLVLADTVAEALPADPEPAVSETVEAEADDAVELIEAEWEDEIWVEPDVAALGEVALAAEEAEVLAISEDADPVLTAPSDDLDAPWGEDTATPGEAILDDGRPDERQADEAEVAQVAAPAAVAEDHAHSAALPPHDRAESRLPAEMIDADGTPLAVLDEAALQEIVRQMIREELQGDLGERITRNVRKLVRAEINRALIARDLD
ncbi:hypothetical protein [Tabrizicola sp.]|uniref:hypothetical protein n=1 Tax=Tabrizicola sp. TaxID=2005166 RepID=UPI0035B23F90